jgi:transglutaminase-like putative cysteine protease
VVDRVGFRGGALAGVLLLTFAYTSVLYHVTDVVGGAALLILVVVGALALATGLGQVLRVRTALAIAVLLAVGGTAVYFLSIPTSQLALLTVDRILSDVVALATGLSVLRLTAADVWALSFTPGPVFLSWYLAVRGRYVAGVAVGGTALGVLVLTGDAGVITTLVGVVGAAVAVGLGELHRDGGTVAQVDTLAVVLATMLVLTATVSVVPGSAARPLVPDRGASTVEANLVSAEDRIEVLGSIRLSPKVRFTVESPRESYWQTAAYDRYTSSGWVRTGDTEPYQGRRADPPGADLRVDQEVTAETPLDSLPAAWKPVAVSGRIETDTEISPQGGLRPGRTIDRGERYTVESRVPQYTTEQLRRAGTDYPDRVAEQYTQLPASISDRVRQRAAEVAGNDTTPYEKAVNVERYLESEKTYSLAVERPEGEVTDAFLFEMDAGYCTYYATAMVTMLRSEGVPARFVVGYTPGQQVEQNEYVVRGLDSHAWVQVYFPEVGWVDFDPTPSDPRQTAERTRLTEARENNETGVDVDDSEEGTWTPTPEPGETTTTTADDDNVTVNRTDGTPPELPAGVRSLEQGRNGSLAGNVTSTPAGGGGVSLPSLPDRETLGFMLVAVVGLAAGARRTGLTRRAAGSVWLRYQGARSDPTADAERAFSRLERLLSARYRPRRPGETPRQYVDALRVRGVDERAVTVAGVYERATYGHGVSREEVEEAIDHVDAMVWEETPLVGRLFT